MQQSCQWTKQDGGQVVLFKFEKLFCSQSGPKKFVCLACCFLFKFCFKNFLFSNLRKSFSIRILRNLFSIGKYKTVFYSDEN